VEEKKHFRKLVKVWENLKKLWKHSPEACVSTAFLVLPNVHSCFYLTWNLFVLYNKETNDYSFFISKSFSITRKPTLAHFGEYEKSHLMPIKNYDWSRKITLLSNLTRRASHGMKSYCKSRIEL